MIKKLLLNDKVILALIILNAIIIFIGGFNFEKPDRLLLSIIDNAITILFVSELVFKLSAYGKSYFKSNWNKFDFTLIILSLPALFAFVFNIEIINFSYLLIFRVMRVFKSFRFLKFIPGIEHLITGIQRALKASVIVLLGFAIYIFIIGIFSFYLFKDTAPHYFSNPINSLYSIFKIFTVEGWFEIPEQITNNLSVTYSFFVYIYFIFIVLSGGIFGLSLVNSIFVDAMVSDNNNDIEKKIDNLDQKINLIIKNSNHGISN